MRNRLSILVLLAFVTGSRISGAADLSRFTGSFSESRYDSGNFYGYKIIIYNINGSLWVLFHDADSAGPQTAEVIIENGLVTFTLPVPGDPGRTRIFKGKVTKNFLIGDFNYLNETIKLKRRPLWQF